MWWCYYKKYENENKVIYSYGREIKTVSGELLYNKNDHSYSVIKPANGDNEKKANWALQHLSEVISAGCPDEKLVAIG